jgi:hypothetical protein
MRKFVRLVVAGLVVGAVAAAGLVGTSSSAGAQPIGYVIVDTVGGCTLHRIDLATGVVDAAIGAAADENCVSDLAFSPDSNTLYGLRTISRDGLFVGLVTFDLATGQAGPFAQIGDFNAFADEGGLAFDSTGILYATLAPVDPDATAPDCRIGVAYCTYRVDPANPGAAVFVGQTAAGETDVGPFAGACDGGFVGSEDSEVDGDAFESDEPAADTAEEPTTTTSAPDAVESELDEAAGFSAPYFLTNVNRGTGLGTPVGLAFGHVVTGFDFDLPGTLWGVGVTIGGPNSVFTIDRATGVATATATITGVGEAEVYALAIPKSCIPELTFTG